MSYQPGTAYLRWVERVLEEIARPQADSSRIRGVVEVRRALGLDERESMESVYDVADDLAEIGLVENRSGGAWLQLTQEGREFRDGVRLQTAWPSIAKQYLDGQQAEFLAKLIEMSERPNDRYVGLELLEPREVFAALGWPTDDVHQFYELTEQLNDVRCVRRMTPSTGGSVPTRPTYYGIVRATQQVQGAWQAELPELIETWETTSVEFKRKLSLKARADKAEFVRDILALVTTQSSGRRLLIVGFGPKTHAFAPDLNPKVTSDHLEDVLNEYVKPALQVRLWRVAWSGGEIGIIEAVRESQKVPYEVRGDIGPLKAGQIFVRHGTHVTEPDPEELVSLREEGRRARGGE